MIKKRYVFLLFVTVFALQAQVITVQNPSFEAGIPLLRELVSWYDPETGGELWKETPRTPTGTGGVFGWTPPPWEICSSTPDLMPWAMKDIDGNDAGSGGMWKGSASHGDWYLGLVCHNDAGGWRESIAQPLSAPLVAGTAYNFSVDLAKAQPYSQAWRGLATGSARFLIYGNMGHSKGCSDLNDGINGQLLWRSPPIGHQEWIKYSIDFTPIKGWTHLYFTMPPASECGINGMNVLIDNISGIDLGGLRVISPDPSTNIPCAHHLTGSSNEPAKLIYIQGRFRGGVLSLTKQNGGISADGKSWTVDAIYGKEFSGSDTLFVTSEYEDNKIPDDAVAVPIFVQSIADMFDVSFTYIDEPVRFTDRTVEFEKSVKLSWNWNFGDAKGSQERHPTHLYSKGGLWEVIERIEYGDFPICTDTLRKTIRLPSNPGTMEVEEQKIVNCSVEIRGRTNYRPDSLLVSGNIVGSPLYATQTSDTTWKAVLYLSSNSASKERVQVSAYFPSNRVDQEMELDVSGLFSVRADFEIDSSKGLWGEIPFIDRSTSPAGVSIIGWEWAFGDDNSSLIQNPKHDYLSAGRQVVSLTVMGSDGCRDWKRDTLRIPRIAVADTGHKYHDTDLDGKLDRVEIHFPYDVTRDLLKGEGVKITFNWLDTAGVVIVVEIDLDQATFDGKRLIWDIPNKIPLKKKMTGKESGVGVAKLEQLVNTETGLVMQEVPLQIADAMVPLIASALINMSVDTKRRPDTLIITFTEIIAFESVTAEHLFSFLVAGDRSVEGAVLDYISTSYKGAGWSKGGKVMTIFFDQASIKKNGVRVFPLDSIKILSGKSGMIMDRAGNTADKKAPWVPILGKLKPQLETNDIWVLDEMTQEKLIGESGKTEIDPFGDLTLLDQSTTLDEASKGQLGLFLTLVVPLLEEGMSRDSLVAALQWRYSAEFYTNLGGFVAKTKGILSCEDPLFDDPSTAVVESCLESRLRKVWIPWNGLSQSGRRAGSGAYIMKAIFGEDTFPPRIVGLSRTNGLRY